jgi:hypothetical protein
MREIKLKTIGVNIHANLPSLPIVTDLTYDREVTVR